MSDRLTGDSRCPDSKETCRPNSRRTPVSDPTGEGIGLGSLPTVVREGYHWLTREGRSRS